MPNYVSLFSGIGGLDLGFDRAGWTCVAQVEIDPWCRSVLAKHWPDVPRHDDVATATEWWHSQERPNVDAVVFGFPCQDISLSRQGDKAGLSGSQSSLYWAALAFARETNPAIVALENVRSLLSSNRGQDFLSVVDSLAQCGYISQWSTISGCSVGAPHTRNRLFLVAHAGSERREGRGGLKGGTESGSADAGTGPEFGGRAGYGGTAVWAGPHESPHTGVADGISRRMDKHRIRGYGNAVMPAVAQVAGTWALDVFNSLSVEA